MVDFGQYVLQGQAFEGLQVAHFAVGRREVVVKHPRDDVGDVRLERVADARVHVLLVDLVEGHRRALHDVDDAPHVAVRQIQQRLPSVFGDVHPVFVSQMHIEP